MASFVEATSEPILLPEVLCFLLNLEANLVAAGSVLLMLHQADHSR